MAMASAPAQMAMASEPSYYSKPDFRDLVNGIKSNGVMTDKMLQYVTATSFTAMIAQQGSGFNSLIKDVSLLTAEVIYTLAVIKILNTYYSEKQALW